MTKSSFNLVKNRLYNDDYKILVFMQEHVPLDLDLMGHFAHYSALIRVSIPN